MKYLSDLFKAHASTALQIIIAVGVFVVFSYWAFVINFVPAGITLSESLLFVFAALMFGFIYSLWLFLAVAAVYGLFHWRAPNQNFDIGLLLIGIITASLLAAAAYGSNNAMVLIAPVMGALMLLMRTWNWNPPRRRETLAQVRRRRQGESALVLGAIILPMVFVPSITAKMISNSMQRLGFRQMDVSVSLDEANQKIVKAMVDELELKSHSCGNGKTSDQILHHVNVLWHGLGERTLIEIPLLADSSGSAYQIDLNRGGVNVIRRHDTQSDSPLCFSLGSDLLFDSYASTLTNEGTNVLDAFVKRIETYQESSERIITAITVIGHSDRTPVKSNNDNNEKLSQRRSESVLEKIKNSKLKNDDMKLEAKAAGARIPVSNCARNLPKAELNECLAADRRVEIIVQTKSK